MSAVRITIVVPVHDRADQATANRIADAVSQHGYSQVMSAAARRGCPFASEAHFEIDHSAPSPAPERGAFAT